MKHTLYITLLIQIACLSCNQINLEDLQGGWSYVPMSHEAPSFTEIIIKDDTIELITDHQFKEIGTVFFKGEAMNIVLKRDKLNIHYKRVRHSLDTLIFQDSLKYVRFNQHLYGNFPSYNLIDIQTKKLLSNEKLFHGIVHYYTSMDNEIQIRCGDKMVKFSDIPIFLEGGHGIRRGPTEILLF